MKYHIALVVLVCASGAAVARKELKISSDRNCTSEADGDYSHSSVCTKFITCSNGYAYERECAACHLSEGPERCPDGQLHFSSATGNCEWADEANCGGGEEDQETTPSPDNSCNPRDCKLVGYCTGYKRCNKDTSQWEQDQCDPDLYWNPNWNKNLTGGSCDSWDNLDPETKELYESDPNCYPFCYYKKIDECSGEFLFHPNGTDHRNEVTLSCPPGLIFDDVIETCRLCQEVTNSTSGAACCESDESISL